MNMNDRCKDSTNQSPYREWPPYYEWLDHTADIGIRVWGADPEALFTNAGRAMFDLLSDIRHSDEGDIERIIVTGADWADLMVNWLRELLYFWTGRERFVFQIEVDSLSDKKIVAKVTTSPYDTDRHMIRHDLKAVTYHQAKVEVGNDGWVGEVIFDV